MNERWLTSSTLAFLDVSFSRGEAGLLLAGLADKHGLGWGSCWTLSTLAFFSRSCWRGEAGLFSAAVPLRGALLLEVPTLSGLDPSTAMINTKNKLVVVLKTNYPKKNENSCHHLLICPHVVPNPNEFFVGVQKQRFWRIFKLLFSLVIFKLFSNLYGRFDFCSMKIRVKKTWIWITFTVL